MEINTYFVLKADCQRKAISRQKPPHWGHREAPTNHLLAFYVRALGS